MNSINECFVNDSKKLLIPVKCFTCGKVVSDKYNIFLDLLDNGYNLQKAFKEIDFKRNCCKRMFTACPTFDSDNFITR